VPETVHVYRIRFFLSALDKKKLKKDFQWMRYIEMKSGKEYLHTLLNMRKGGIR